jgi:uncharacterized protein YndB with AHSA1/START domain
MENATLKSKEAVLTVTKEFNAPRELVFEAFANADALAEWWGPVGFTMTITQFDFRTNGICLFKMEKENLVMWAKLVYGAIRKPDYLEITLSFSNEQAGLTRAPFFDAWPMYIRNEFTLTEKDGKTTVTNNSYPVQATPVEVESFLENQESFKGGLTASMERLMGYLIRK